MALSDEWKGWGDFELMDHDIWIDPEHVLMTAGKDVQVVPQEKDQPILDRRAGLRADVSDLNCVFIIQEDGF